jgi:predicted ATPase/transcriptional regulator with XRE-family HTH domain
MVRRFRVAAALSQEALAERSGISARAVSDLERGLRTTPRLETVRMLADALSLSAADRAMLLSASRPETVQPPVSHDSSGSTAGAPGLTVVPLRLQTLPVPPTRLIGRELIVEQVTALLRRDDGRLVTLVGPGGVGKTRLAIAVASAMSDGDGQEAVFVDLSPVTEPGLALAAVAAALGLRELGERPLQETLADFLRARSILLLLDNAEHLLEFAPALSVLLQQCPSLKLLVTSRQPLRLRGEHEVHVDPLPVPEPGMSASVEAVARIEAVRLFVDRARDVRPDFELTESNVADVAEVCRRLDGLPLAIELAAPRIRLLGLPELRERLQNQLGLLTGGARDAPDRQKTLRDTIAWSYDLLSPPEQRFFCRLAVFVGGFTLESAAAVVGSGEGDTFEMVSSLLEKSLLQAVTAADGPPRFRMLVSIREFGLEQLLRRGDETETRQRHFNYFRSLTESMAVGSRIRHSDPHWYVHDLARIDLELDNLRAAWRWAEEHGDSVGAVRIVTNLRMYWSVRPFGEEVLSEVDKLLRTAQIVPAGLRASAAIVAANMAAWLGDYDGGFAHSERALAAARESGDVVQIGGAYVLFGVLWEVSGDCLRSAEAYREAAKVLRNESDSILLGIALGELGDRLLFCGDIDDGIQLIEEALEHGRRLGYGFAVGLALGQRAHAARLQGDLAGATRLFWESMAEAGAIGDERRVLGAFIGLAGVALDEGQPERAAQLIGATEAARETRGVSRVIAHPLHNARIYAAVQEQLGDDEYAKLVAEGRMIPFDQVLAGALVPLQSDSG